MSFNHTERVRMGKGLRPAGHGTYVLTGAGPLAAYGRHLTDMSRKGSQTYRALVTTVTFE